MSGPGRASTGRVGGGQFPADRHRLLGDRQRLGRTAQQREQGAEVAHRPAPRHERRAQRGPRRNQARLRAELARIDTAERGLITELEEPADPGDPAARACRARIRARFADLYAERTRIEATLAELAAAAPPDNDPSVLDLLPYAAGVFTQAPARIQEALLTAFDIHALYRSDMHQVTI